MPIIYGFLERITFHNEENDFVVAKLQEKGKGAGFKSRTATIDFNNLGARKGFILKA